MDIIHIQAIALWISSLGLLVYSLFKLGSETERSRVLLVAVLVFVYALVSTVLLGGATWNTLFAPDMMWTGALSLMAIMLIAWLAAPRLDWQTVKLFFCFMAGTALLSLLYGAPEILEGGRLGGLVAQPNVLAIMLGSGLIAGLYTKEPMRIGWRFFGVLSITLAIFLTQTRGVIVMVPLIVMPFAFMHTTIKRQYLVGLATLIVVISCIAAPRLANIDRLTYGVTYRYDLASYSTRYLQVMPPWGFGPGGLSNVVGEFYELPPSLEATILVDQKTPESSHIIFIDRFIEYGWLGGVSYLVVVGLFIAQAYKKRQDDLVKVLAAIGLFVLVQQMITVPRFHTELIAWVTMLGAILYRPTKSETRDV